MLFFTMEQLVDMIRSNILTVDNNIALAMEEDSILKGLPI